MAKKVPTLLDVLGSDLIVKRKCNPKIEGHGYRINGTVFRDASGRKQAGGKSRVAFTEGTCISEKCPGVILINEEGLGA